jgi:hypothetical protein
VDSEQQKSHDRDVKIAKNEAKRELVSDVRLSTWAISLAAVFGLLLLVFYLARK